MYSGIEFQIEVLVGGSCKEGLVGGLVGGAVFFRIGKRCKIYKKNLQNMP